MTYDAKLARARDLIAKRDDIDVQLAELFGAEVRRGRPRKARQGELDAASAAVEIEA
jgi:hypothetical protein